MRKIWRAASAAAAAPISLTVAWREKKCKYLSNYTIQLCTEYTAKTLLWVEWRKKKSVINFSEKWNGSHNHKDVTKFFPLIWLLATSFVRLHKRKKPYLTSRDIGVEHERTAQCTPTLFSTPSHQVKMNKKGIYIYLYGNMREWALIHSLAFINE